MGATRSSPPPDPALRDVRSAVAASLARALPAGGRIAVALSGGRDSVVLFDAVAELADRAPYSVVAFHVDHGLSPHAGAWAQFAKNVCATRGVGCRVRKVRVARAPRASLEASARTARYEALESMARVESVQAVLLAHHADDQAETTLLQLLRGAGPRGLAAMPAARFDGNVWWLRPLLELPRARLAAYAAALRLDHVDDESNADPRYRRNALRASVVPELRKIASGYPVGLLRSAQLQADAAALLDDLARIDARELQTSAGLDRAGLARLDDARARNVLRWFLRQQGLPAPSQARLRAMTAQLKAAASDARVELWHAGARIGVHRGRIVMHPPASPAFETPWDGADEVALPHGTLRLTRARGEGIGLQHLASARVTIRSGSRGERLQLAGRSARRNVADLLREAGVPHWERRALPRVVCGDALAAVVPLGVDVRFAAAALEPGITFEWRPATQRPEG
jgi:tRNA(Ile)-lysidine synthase